MEKPQPELGDVQLSPLFNRVSAVCPVLTIFGYVRIPALDAVEAEEEEEARQQQQRHQQLARNGLSGSGHALSPLSGALSTPAAATARSSTAGPPASSPHPKRPAQDGEAPPPPPVLLSTHRPEVSPSHPLQQQQHRQYTACIHVHGYYPYFLVPQYDRRVSAVQFGAQLETVALRHIFERTDGRGGGGGFGGSRYYQLAPLVPSPSSTGLAGADGADRAAAGGGLSSSESVLVRGFPPVHGQLLHSVDLVSRLPFYGYHSHPYPFYCVRVIDPSHLLALVALLQATTHVGGRRWQAYEAHHKYHSQFMVDYDLKGMATVELPRRCSLRAPSSVGSCCWDGEGGRGNRTPLLLLEQRPPRWLAEHCGITGVQAPDAGRGRRARAAALELDVDVADMRDAAAAALASPGSHLTHVRRLVRLYFAEHGVTDRLRKRDTITTELARQEEWRCGRLSAVGCVMSKGKDDNDGPVGGNEEETAADATAAAAAVVGDGVRPRYGSVGLIQRCDPVARSLRLRMLAFLRERESAAAAAAAAASGDGDNPASCSSAVPTDRRDGEGNAAVKADDVPAPQRTKAPDFAKREVQRPQWVDATAWASARHPSYLAATQPQQQRHGEEDEEDVCLLHDDEEANPGQETQANRVRSEDDDEDGGEEKLPLTFELLDALARPPPSAADPAFMEALFDWPSSSSSLSLSCSSFPVGEKDKNNDEETTPAPPAEAPGVAPGDCFAWLLDCTCLVIPPAAAEGTAAAGTPHVLPDNNSRTHRFLLRHAVCRVVEVTTTAASAVDVRGSSTPATREAPPPPTVLVQWLYGVSGTHLEPDAAELVRRGQWLPPTGRVAFTSPSPHVAPEGGTTMGRKERGTTAAVARRCCLGELLLGETVSDVPLPAFATDTTNGSSLFPVPVPFDLFGSSSDAVSLASCVAHTPAGATVQLIRAAVLAPLRVELLSAAPVLSAMTGATVARVAAPVRAGLPEGASLARLSCYALCRYQYLSEERRLAPVPATTTSTSVLVADDDVNGLMSQHGRVSRRSRHQQRSGRPSLAELPVRLPAPLQLSRRGSLLLLLPLRQRTGSGPAPLEETLPPGCADPSSHHLRGGVSSGSDGSDTEEDEEEEDSGGEDASSRHPDAANVEAALNAVAAELSAALRLTRTPVAETGAAALILGVLPVPREGGDSFHQQTSLSLGSQRISTAAAADSCDDFFLHRNRHHYYSLSAVDGNSGCDGGSLGRGATQSSGHPSVISAEAAEQQLALTQFGERGLLLLLGQPPGVSLTQLLSATVVDEGSPCGGSDGGGGRGDLGGDEPLFYFDSDSSVHPSQPQSQWSCGNGGIGAVQTLSPITVRTSASSTVAATQEGVSEYLPVAVAVAGGDGSSSAAAVVLSAEDTTSPRTSNNVSIRGRGCQDGEVALPRAVTLPPASSSQLLTGVYTGSKCGADVDGIPKWFDVSTIGGDSTAAATLRVSSALLTHGTDDDGSSSRGAEARLSPTAAETGKPQPQPPVAARSATAASSAVVSQLQFRICPLRVVYVEVIMRRSADTGDVSGGRVLAVGLGTTDTESEAITARLMCVRQGNSSSSRGQPPPQASRPMPGSAGRVPRTEYPSEACLLLAVVDEINRLDPDLVVSWEGFKYGLGLLALRYRLLLGRSLAHDLSRFLSVDQATRAALVESTMRCAQTAGTDGSGGGGIVGAAAAAVVLNDGDAVYTHDDKGNEEEEEEDNDDDDADPEAAAAAAASAAVTDPTFVARRFTQRFGTTVRIAGRVSRSLGRDLRKSLSSPSYTLAMVHQRVLGGESFPYLTDTALGRLFLSECPGDRFFAESYLVGCLAATHRIARVVRYFTAAAESSAMYGILFDEVLARGSQFRVEATLVRMARPANYAMLSPSRLQVWQQPRIQCIPLIMQPRSGFYGCEDPVLVFDFRSLYPSVAIAYNLCYTTCLGTIQPHTRGRLGFLDRYRQDNALLSELLPDEQVGGGEEGGEDTLHPSQARWSADDPSRAFRGGDSEVTISPNGAMFLTTAIRRGIVPQMLQAVLDTRFEAQAAVTHVAGPSGDTAMAVRLHQRQQALKMLANVTYGYTAASYTGRMPCVDLAEAIVSLGRQTLERAIALIHANDRWDAEVVYGDTDSMFVRLRGNSNKSTKHNGSNSCRRRTKDEAFAVAEEIAAAVTVSNPVPIRLQLEKVLSPCLLLVKKRYVGYAWFHKGQKEPEWLDRGIETVRRDQCPATAALAKSMLTHLFDSDLRHYNAMKGGGGGGGHGNTKQSVSLHPTDATPAVDVHSAAWRATLRERYARVVAPLLRGESSPADFIFRRGVKLGRYGDGDDSRLTLAARLALQRMERDLLATPHRGERLPYLVVESISSDRLRDQVAHPEAFLFLDAPEVALDADYYIQRHLNSALDRLFYLLGVSFAAWYRAMPRGRRGRRAPMQTAAPVTLLMPAGTAGRLRAVIGWMAGVKRQYEEEGEEEELDGSSRRDLHNGGEGRQTRRVGTCGAAAAAEGSIFVLDDEEGGDGDSPDGDSCSRRRASRYAALPGCKRSRRRPRHAGPVSDSENSRSVPFLVEEIAAEDEEDEDGDAVDATSSHSNHQGPSSRHPVQQQKQQRAKRTLDDYYPITTCVVCSAVAVPMEEHLVPFEAFLARLRPGGRHGQQHQRQQMAGVEVEDVDATPSPPLCPSADSDHNHNNHHRTQLLVPPLDAEGLRMAIPALCPSCLADRPALLSCVAARSRDAANRLAALQSRCRGCFSFVHSAPPPVVVDMEDLAMAVRPPPSSLPLSRCAAVVSPSSSSSWSSATTSAAAVGVDGTGGENSLGCQSCDCRLNYDKSRATLLSRQLRLLVEYLGLVL